MGLGAIPGNPDDAARAKGHVLGNLRVSDGAVRMTPSMGLCYGCLGDTSLPELIAVAGRHGFTSIMVYQEHWKRHAVPPAAELRRMLDANGIRRVTLDGVLAFLPRIDSWAKTLVDSVDDYFRMADQVGAVCFNVPHYTGDPATPCRRWSTR